ncbi:YciI family protein [Solicola gregarius]|uniref:YciI family protein n=1 Tax=Solicola gregarius TaxID=2908642 RepID=A0AA46TLW2_9ACTN|nr:YciI family protein [Solicola gregarius]UYM07660.1 YciI family protein [Solicola gregarius]
MKYLILIYDNPASRDIWLSMPDDERVEGVRAYVALTADLEASGESIAHEALDRASAAKQVEVRDGRTIVTDGPFAEAKEELAGFYLVDCDDMDRAVAYAARIPEAEFGRVEVHPTIDLSDIGL